MTTKVVGKMEGRILWAIEIRAKQRDCVLVCSNLSTGTLFGRRRVTQLLALALFGSLIRRSVRQLDPILLVMCVNVTVRSGEACLERERERERERE